MIRRLRSILMWVALVMAIPSTALGHGLELARDDAPIPVTLFLGGAVVVLAVSFIGVSKTWTTSRLQGGGGGGGGPRSDRVAGTFGTKMVPVARWTGVVCLALVVITGLGAGDLGYGGLSPILVWIGFWLAVPFVSAVVGDVWTPMNPWRRMGEWLGLGERERPELLERWGVYPAAVLLGAFAWFEIVYPESASGVVAGRGRTRVHGGHGCRDGAGWPRNRVADCRDIHHLQPGVLGGCAQGTNRRRADHPSRLAAGASRPTPMARPVSVRGSDDRDRQL